MTLEAQSPQFDYKGVPVRAASARPPRPYVFVFFVLTVRYRAPWADPRPRRCTPKPPTPGGPAKLLRSAVAFFIFAVRYRAPWAEPRPRRCTPPPPARGGLVKSRTSAATSAVLVLTPAHCGAACTVKNRGTIFKKMKVRDSALWRCARREKPGTCFEKDESARRQTAPSS